MTVKEKANKQPENAHKSDDAGAAGQQSEHEFSIQKIYIKDASFESPNAAEMFQTEWKPKVQVDLQTSGSPLNDDVHEAVLSLTVTVKNDDKTAFIAEVKKAGIFIIRNYAPEQLKLILATVCPNILFPYAREVISDLIVRGGFPTLYLNPVNFEALYAQQQAKLQSKNKQTENEAATNDSE